MTHDSTGTHIPTLCLYALVTLRTEKSVSQRSAGSTGEETQSYPREHMIFVFNFYTKLTNDTIFSKLLFNPLTIAGSNEISHRVEVKFKSPFDQRNRF